MTENKSFLNCKLVEVKVLEDMDDYYVFEGYAATFGNIDLGDDMIEKGAFTQSIKDKMNNAVPINGTQYSKLMPILWQHDWSQPVGSFVEMSEDDKGLFVKGIMPKADTLVSGRVAPQMKAGSISDMSIGYCVVDQRREKDIRIIEEAKLFEISLVTIPMNPLANITGFKSMDKLGVADKSAEWSGDDEMGASIKDGNVKLNISCDVDGKEKIIPAALFKAAHDIHSNDEMAKAKPIIEDAYKKMGMESPFSQTKSFRLDDAKSLSEREFESLLRSGVCFSQKMAKQIISLLNDDAQRDVDAKSQRDAELKNTLTKLLSTLN